MKIEVNLPDNINRNQFETVINLLLEAWEREKCKPSVLHKDLPATFENYVRCLINGASMINRTDVLNDESFLKDLRNFLIKYIPIAPI